MSRQAELAALGRVSDTSALSNRNLIINGAMQVAQRGTSTAITSSSAFTMDRFEIRLGGSYTVGATVTQESDGPSGFSNCLKVDITSTSTPATSNNFMLDYSPEAQDLAHLGWGSSGGKQLTLSFWVKSNKVGLYGLGIIHDAKTRNWLSSYTISAADTWEYKTILIDADSSTAIDDDNGRCIRMNWHLSAGPDDLTSAHSWQSGSSFESVTGQVNLCDSTSNYWQITGVQLEVGDTATEFEHRLYADELARCQRYYQDIPAIRNLTMARYTHASGQSNTFIQSIGIMRSSPTVTVSGTFNASSGFSGTPTLGNIYTNGFQVVGSTSRAAGYVEYMQSTDTPFKLDAEL